MEIWEQSQVSLALYGKTNWISANKTLHAGRNLAKKKVGVLDKYSIIYRLDYFYSKILRRDSQMGILLLKLPSPNEKKQNSTFGPPSWSFQNPPIQHQQNFPIRLKLNQ
ncbi:hypothetical protein V8G54_004184, partial [Vigna mungo]